MGAIFFILALSATGSWCEHETSKIVISKSAYLICYEFNLFFNFSKRSQMLADLLDEYPILLLAAEAGVALLILLFIVFWTMQGRKKDE
jgi:hypothetical protein